MVPLRLSTGEEAELVSLAGVQAAIVSPRAFAPGAPLSFEVRLEDGPLALEGKSHGSRRRDDGRYDVRLRMVNMRRSERLRLEAMVQD